jgi:hypothetical protein
LAYQPPANSIFLSQQTSHQQPANSTFLSEQISTSHQPPAKRTGCPLFWSIDFSTVILRVPLFDKPTAEDGGWWNISEGLQVLSLEDLIVPTTPYPGFQPLLTPSSPKVALTVTERNWICKILLRFLSSQLSIC